jgi:hypothetical protein
VVVGVGHQAASKGDSSQAKSRNYQEERFFHILLLWLIIWLQSYE